MPLVLGPLGDIRPDWGLLHTISHGLIRVLRGETMGVDPNANQVAVDGSLRAPDKSHRLNRSSLLTRQQASTVSGYF